MPELPEVELVKRDLKALEGFTILDYKLSDTVIHGHNNNRRTIIKENLEQFNRVKNTTIIEVQRRGKYMYFHLVSENDDFYLISHLGMSGGFFHVNTVEDITEPNYKKHWHVQLNLDNATALIYSDIRRFGELRTVNSLEEFPPFQKMAPEYTDRNARTHFIETLKSGKYNHSFIKAIIMDSKIIPGVGNIYASEALYRSKILPTKKVENISKKRLSTLFDAIVEVFELSLNSGGSTISDYRSTTGESGSMQDKFQVYGKKECPFGHTLKQKVIAKRNTYYCTTCQR